MLRNRLEELGSTYGSLPVHEGLWQTAAETSDSLFARLALVHMVHEARGIDITPKTIEKFRSSNDEESARMLVSIYEVRLF